jgi:putative methionine-R-sulfoxide reductase with GAF domain
MSSAVPHDVLHAHTADAALAAVVRAIAADSGTVHFLRDDGCLHLGGLSGPLPPPLIERIRTIPLGKGMAGACAQMDQPVTWCNLNQDDRGIVQPGARMSGMEGAIVVPIRRDGRLVGTLGVANHGERTYTPGETAFLESCAAAIARFA